MAGSSAGNCDSDVLRKCSTFLYFACTWFARFVIRTAPLPIFIKKIPSCQNLDTKTNSILTFSSKPGLGTPAFQKNANGTDQDLVANPNARQKCNFVHKFQEFSPARGLATSHLHRFQRRISPMQSTTNR